MELINFYKWCIKKYGTNMITYPIVGLIVASVFPGCLFLGPIYFFYLIGSGLMIGFLIILGNLSWMAFRDVREVYREYKREKEEEANEIVRRLAGKDKKMSVEEILGRIKAKAHKV